MDYSKQVITIHRGSKLLWNIDLYVSDARCWYGRRCALVSPSNTTPADCLITFYATHRSFDECCAVIRELHRMAEFVVDPVLR